MKEKGRNVLISNHDFLYKRLVIHFQFIIYYFVACGVTAYKSQYAAGIFKKQWQIRIDAKRYLRINDHTKGKNITDWSFSSLVLSF